MMKGQFKDLVLKKILVVCLTLCVCLGLIDCMNQFTVKANEAMPEYKIMVNRIANCVTVYERDAAGNLIPVRAFACSCGREGHETPLGEFSTSDYYNWRQMVDGSYSQFAVRFNRGIMFHSIPYYTKNAGNMEWEQFNLLGQPASLGCVRLTCGDAKWIFDNCRQGTEVVVYDDADNPGPLGKPLESKVAEENPMRQWDPTDISSQNPWQQVKPSLYLTNDMGDGVLYVPVGSSIDDVYNAVGVRDAAGLEYEENEYTISVSGKYDLNSIGVYRVTIKGHGTPGGRAEQEMYLCVVG